MGSSDREVLVLLSGGIDSAACIEFYLDFGRPPCGLFVDYGQPAAAEEEAAANAVAAYYSVPLTCVRVAGCSLKSAGLIPSRNLFLLSLGALERPRSVSIIGIGIHAGTAYEDCSPPFLAAAESAVRAGGDTTLQLSAPFVTWTKREVYEYCRRRAVPVHLTYSCESRGGPCGTCLSCQDRRLLNACA